MGGSKPRLVLVQLLLNPNRVVSSDALIDALWGDDPPPSARRSLQAHVAKLRAALGGDAGPVRSQPPGYVLVVDEDQVDLWRSEALVRQARARSFRTPGRLITSPGKLEDCGPANRWRTSPRMIRLSRSVADSTSSGWI